MPTQQNERPRHIAALDGLRGAAVLLVFLYHYGGGAQSGNVAVRAFGVLDKAGWCGVTLFFVLSGFLITGILLESFDEPHWVRNFYMRRLLRIFPLYYAAIAVLVAAGAWQGALRPTLKLAGVFAIFCQNMPFFPLPARVAAPVYHLWSIAVEEQFYLLWPLLLWMARARRKAHWLCLAGFAASVAARIVIWHFAPDPDLYESTLLARGGELTVGASLAILARTEHWGLVRRLAPAVGRFTLVIFAGCAWMAGSFALEGRWQWLVGLPAISVCFGAVLVLATGPGLVQRVTSVRWLCWLGRISYGVYVFHILLLHNVNSIAARLAGGRIGSKYEAVRFVVAAVLSVGAAWLSYRYFERPFLRLKKRFPAGPALARR